MNQVWSFEGRGFSSSVFDPVDFNSIVPFCVQNIESNYVFFKRKLCCVFTPLCRKVFITASVLYKINWPVQSCRQLSETWHTSGCSCARRSPRSPTRSSPPWRPCRYTCKQSVSLSWSSHQTISGRNFLTLTMTPPFYILCKWAEYFSDQIKAWAKKNTEVMVWCWVKASNLFYW